MDGFGPRCEGCRQHLVPGALRGPPRLGERVLSRGPWWTRRLRDLSPRGRLRVHGGAMSRTPPPPPPPSCSTGKSWLHFRPPPVDFCSSRLAIGAATERARALAMPAGTRAQALQTRL